MIEYPKRAPKNSFKKLIDRSTFVPQDREKMLQLYNGKGQPIAKSKYQISADGRSIHIMGGHWTSFDSILRKIMQAEEKEFIEYHYDRVPTRAVTIKIIDIENIMEEAGFIEE